MTTGWRVPTRSIAQVTTTKLEGKQKAMFKILKASTSALPYLAAGVLGSVVLPDLAYAAGGGNPIITFLNTCVTQGTLAGFGIAAIGLMGVGGGMATGNHQFVGPGIKAGAGGTGIAGASQLVGLFIPNAAGASINLTTVSVVTGGSWLHLISSVFS